ncbi:HK97 family phage prohead protease [Desulfurobacterium crinifex]|jgi:DNA repair exonuclease SbcCD ATPase subunit
MENRTLILQASASGYDLVETDDYVEIPVRAISSGIQMTPLVNYEPTTVVFSSRAVEKAGKTLKGKPVLLEHWESVENVVGVVSKTEIKGDKEKEVIAFLRIPKQGQEKLIALIKMKPTPIKAVSIGGSIKEYTVSEGEERVITIEDFEADEISLVFRGAHPDAKRLDAKKPNNTEDKVEEKLKALQAQVEKLQAELKLKEGEIEKLQAELKARTEEVEKLKAEKAKLELDQLKAQKLSEVPEDVRDILKASLEVATTKEQIEKLTATFKENLPKLTAGTGTINPPTETETREKDSPFMTY